MKIDISLNSIDEARELLREFGRTTCESADRPTGWVSHPVADPANEPPSVMTVATTECAPEDGAEPDIDGNIGESAGERDFGEAYARAEAVANFIIKNLLDLEAWLDKWLSGDEDATVERVRFHADVSYDGRSITMYRLIEYRNADRCMVPREDGRIRKWAVPPDDDFLEDFEAGAVRSCVSWVCNEFGIELDEYLDRDGKAGGAEPDGETSVHNEVCVETTEKTMADVPDEEAAYVWRIVSGRLSALERWAESKAGKPVISVGVTLSGDTVLVRIIEHSDMECDPLMVRETKVKKGGGAGTYVNRILSEAYNVVFGTFGNLSYSEFVDHISVAGGTPRDADNEEYE